jgi:Na+/serine symporter
MLTLIEGAVSDAAKNKASNIQGITVGGYTLGCFFGAVATIWLGESFPVELANVE